jgi:membrane protein YdbS with pleckstrin-like domain
MLEKKVKLKESERIISLVRRYSLTLFWWFVLIALLFVIPFFFMFWLFRHGWWGQALFIVPVFLGIMLIIRTIFIWQKNVFVITTHRLIDIDQRGFFDQVVSEIPYDQIEDVSGRVKGFWGTIFRYGIITIQTGSGKVQIIVEKIKQPLYLQQEINELRERHLSKYSHDFSGDVASVIIDKIYELDLPDLLRVMEVLVKRVNKLKE